MATFGTDLTREDADSYDEYVSGLVEKLSIIHNYWAAKSLEIKNKAADAEIDSFTKLELNDLCVRVSYIGGRRMVHGTVRIQSEIGSNTFLVRDEHGKLFKCHGYQLLKVFEHPFRPNAITTIRSIDLYHDEYYVIEKILDYNPERSYLVQWQGYPSSYNSWQRSSDTPSAFRNEMARIRKLRTSSE